MCVYVCVSHHCFAGALVILGGVVVVLVPKFLHPSAGESDKPVFNSIYLISVVPMALSSVYKEMYAYDSCVRLCLLLLPLIFLIASA